MGVWVYGCMGVWVYGCMGDNVDVGPWSWGGLGTGSSVMRGLLVCRSHVVGRRIDRPVV